MPTILAEHVKLDKRIIDGAIRETRALVIECLMKEKYCMARQAGRALEAVLDVERSEEMKMGVLQPAGAERCLPPVEQKSPVRLNI